ncbi:MAG: hypothetical protein WC458_03065 [Patescibacteria group bacterium]
MAEESQKKFFLMKTGVIGLALLILIFWIFNLRNVWRIDQAMTVKNGTDEWSELKADLNETLGNIQSQLNQIEEKNKERTAAAGSALLTDLVKETERLPLEPTSATTTATSTVVAATGTIIIAY